MIRRIAWAGVIAGVALAACAKPGSASGGANVAPLPAGDAVGHYGVEVLHVWPHDPGAFTQGLVWRDGDFLESTGLNGESSLRDVDPASGRVLKRIAVPNQYFAEGLAVIGQRAFQLTWQNGIGFIYDADTFRQLGTFEYTGEGWGLATDGKVLVMSDGTSTIRFLDPATFKVLRTIEVKEHGQPVVRLNELEWIQGEIFANVWQTAEIVRIDPQTGAVRGVIDCTGLLPRGDYGPQTDVLNGIAYDPDHDRLFLTGKKWPKLFEVRLVPKS